MPIAICAYSLERSRFWVKISTITIVELIASTPPKNTPSIFESPISPAAIMPSTPIAPIWNAMPKTLGAKTFFRRSRLNSMPTKNIMNITPSSPSSAMSPAEEISPLTGASRMPTIMNPSSSGSFSIEKMRIETVAETTIIAKSFNKRVEEWESIFYKVCGQSSDYLSAEISIQQDANINKYLTQKRRPALQFARERPHGKQRGRKKYITHGFVHKMVVGNKRRKRNYRDDS